jgi:cytochrome P450
MSDVLQVVRSKSVHNAPEAFADVAGDPVNGAVNVAEFLAEAVAFTEGLAHRDRRRLLNQLVRPDALDVIREDVILPAAERILRDHFAGAADVLCRLDLVEFLESVFIHFTAKLIGLDGVDTADGLARLRSCASSIAAGSSSAFLDDRTAINEEALEAKRRYVDEFFRPSLERSRGLLRDGAAGLPRNLIAFIAAGASPDYGNEAHALAESTFLFAASVGTSTQSIVHTVAYLDEWFKRHPEDLARKTDIDFLLRSLQETIRLRAPFSPYTTRIAAEDCDVAGYHLNANQELHIEWCAANRDTGIFGEDSGEFNPRRPSPGNGIPRYGVGFGTGIHQCLGLRVVLGNEGGGGAHLRLLQRLMAAGIEPDPDSPPRELKKNMSKFQVVDIPRYTRFPVVFTAPHD